MRLPWRPVRNIDSWLFAVLIVCAGIFCLFAWQFRNVSWPPPKLPFLPQAVENALHHAQFERLTQQAAKLETALHQQPRFAKVAVDVDTSIPTGLLLVTDEKFSATDKTELDRLFRQFFPSKAMKPVYLEWNEQRYIINGSPDNPLNATPPPAH